MVNDKLWTGNFSVSKIEKTGIGTYQKFDNQKTYDAALYNTIELLREKEYSYKKVSTHNGYISRFSIAVIPYNGRFGQGYILITHYTKDKVQYNYFLEGCKNGSNANTRS